MSRVILISVACLVFAASIAAADKKCEQCIEESSYIKVNLTQELIDRWAADASAQCRKICDEDQKYNCYKSLADSVEQYEYLLKHSVKEFCEWLGLCKRDSVATLLIAPLGSMINGSRKAITLGATVGKVGEMSCDECLDSAQQLKPLLTPEVIDQIIAKEAAKCRRMRDPYEQRECYARLKQLRPILEYLMTHSPREFCQWAGVCPYAKLEISKFFQSLSNNSVKGNKCEQCLKDASEVKPQLTPATILKLITQETKKCLKISDPSARRICLERVSQLKEMLDYLMNHSVEEFCKHYGACPGARMLANLF